MPNPNAATINLQFSSFVANSNPAPSSGIPLGSFCLTSSLAFANDNSGNPINASGQVTISGTTITIKRNTQGNGNQPIKITFNVSCAADSINYNPQSVYFDQQSGSGDGNGNNNFPQADRNPKDQSVTISDTMANPASGGTPFSWNCYIQIKQMNTTGAQPLGWIDPLMANDVD